jgi:hypothetical protein
MPIEISFTGPARLIQVARAFLAGISRLRDVRVVFTPFEQVPFAGAGAVGTRVLSETQVSAHFFFNKQTSESQPRVFIHRPLTYGCSNPRADWEPTLMY